MNFDCQSGYNQVSHSHALLYKIAFQPSILPPTHLIQNQNIGNPLSNKSIYENQFNFLANLQTYQKIYLI